ncbi:MAG: S41 family peptidase, partial [Bacteroidota bacterium]
MKNYLILFLLIILSGQRIFGQPINCPECKYLLDTTIHIMKINSVNAKTVDWKKVETEINNLSKKCQNLYELGPSFNYLYNALNDFHGAFFIGDSSYNWEQKAPVYSKAINDEFEKAVHGIPLKTAIVENEYGYLRIPSMMSFLYGQNVSDSLCRLLRQNIKGLIIDLRLNAGGNMYPMLLGVNPVLGNGKIGSFNVSGKTNQDWLLQDNNFYVDTTLVTSLKSGCIIRADNIPVVLICSNSTGSAGEDFIIAFKGRPNTVLIGEKTAGYVTINDGFV